MNNSMHIMHKLEKKSRKDRKTRREREDVYNSRPSGYEVYVSQGEDTAEKMREREINQINKDYKKSTRTHNLDDGSELRSSYGPSRHSDDMIGMAGAVYGSPSQSRSRKERREKKGGKELTGRADDGYKHHRKDPDSKKSAKDRDRRDRSSKKSKKDRKGEKSSKKKKRSREEDERSSTRTFNKSAYEERWDSDYYTNEVGGAGGKDGVYKDKACCVLI